MSDEIGSRRTEMPPARSVLAVCAHPDDESFGLGALLEHFARAGSDVTVLCFTRGEASTLGCTHAAQDELAEMRRLELSEAAVVLGVHRVELGDHPDGGLAAEPLGHLAAEVAFLADDVEADLLLVFDEGGITGHPDHRRATQAALRGAPTLPALAWSLPLSVAEALNSGFGTAFVGRAQAEIDLVLPVDRARQRQAIACHASQSGDNPVLDRRLALLGDSEWLRWLRRPGEAAVPGDRSTGGDPAATGDPPQPAGHA